MPYNRTKIIQNYLKYFFMQAKDIFKTLGIFIVIFFLLPVNFISAQNLSRLEIATIDQFQKVAPGESLPIALKLLNMGGTGRVDVEITYQIENAQKQVLTEEVETVAVETTAAFIKQLKIPSDLKPGRYYILASLKYSDQKTPAVSRTPFQIEYKYFGFFRDELIILASVIGLGIIFILLIVYFINKKRKIVISRFEYKNIAKEVKPYFELISDIILTMRTHLGDNAITIANQLDGLKVAESGEVLELKKEPMEIVTLLSLEYEKKLGYGDLHISENALKLRNKRSDSLEDQIEYQKTSKLLNNVQKYFIKK
jgi:hypothetical protein